MSEFKETGQSMSAVQRVILFGAAAMIALLTWFSFAEGYINGVDWLWPSLAVAALLFFGVRDLQAPKAAASANPATTLAAPQTRSQKMDDAIERFGSVVSSLASTIKLKNEILLVIAPSPTPGDADVQALHGSLVADAEVQAFVLAYTVHWHQPNRRPKGLPSEPEFLFYRTEIKRRLIACVTGGPHIPDTVSTTMGREVVPANAHHEVFATNKLGDADQRRMEFEHGAKLDTLLEPALDAALFADPDRAKLALARIIAKHFRAA